jgi:hypothetical protein
VIINSLDVDKGIAMLDAGRLDDLADYLAAGLEPLVRAGRILALSLRTPRTSCLTSYNNGQPSLFLALCAPLLIVRRRSA